MSFRTVPQSRPVARGPKGVAALFPRQGEWTEADYLSLPESSRIVELSNQRLVIPDLPGDRHQNAVVELVAAIRDFVKQRDLGYVRVAPMRVRLWPGKFREPDILFLTKAHRDRRGEEFWGVPDLVVEVLSPRTERSSGTEQVDRREKFREYQKAGVSEYWLVDLKLACIEIFVLRDGIYELLGKWGETETLRSELLAGFTIDVAGIVCAPD
ncbi:MAG: Uma2 family endonuclease [Armatimonadetes bacterium]|nr:Uma2 family endonuclease [Armatimonadota bacterium]